MTPAIGRLVGALTLMAGVIFPMVLVGWLALRMNKKPALAPDRLGLILSFNFMLPVGLVLTGMGLLSPAFGAVAWVRTASIVALAGAVIVLVLLGVSRGRRAG